MIDFELFKEFVSMYDDTNVLYFPDRFVRIVHEEYLNCGVVQLPHPLFATWDLTMHCNLSCGFCSAASQRSNMIIDRPESLDIANKIIKWGVKYVSIRGGEPSLVSQLPFITKLFLDAGLFVEIVTNGTYINEEFFNTIKGSNWIRLRIKISLDSHLQQINDMLRGANSFLYAIRAMDICSRNKFGFRSQMVLTSLNREHIEATYNLVNNKGASSFAIMIVLPMGRGKNYRYRIELDNSILMELIKLKKEQKSTLIEKIGIGMEAMRYYDLFNTTSNPDYDVEKIRILKCNGGKTRIYISPEGDVYPCEMMRFPEYKLGNVIRDKLNVMWNCDVLRRFNAIRRQDIVGCASCDNKICDTGCYGIYYEQLKNGIRRPNCES